MAELIKDPKKRVSRLRDIKQACSSRRTFLDATPIIISEPGPDVFGNNLMRLRQSVQSLKIETTSRTVWKFGRIEHSY